MEQATLNIKGMTCGHCQSAVTNALKELNGVEKVDVHLDKGTASVSYDESKVTTAKMKTAIEEQGYDVA